MIYKVIKFIIFLLIVLAYLPRDEINTKTTYRLTLRCAMQDKSRVFLRIRRKSLLKQSFIESRSKWHIRRTSLMFASSLFTSREEIKIFSIAIKDDFTRDNYELNFWVFLYLALDSFTTTWLTKSHVNDLRLVTRLFLIKKHFFSLTFCW